MDLTKLDLDPFIPLTRIKLKSEKANAKKCARKYTNKVKLLNCYFCKKTFANLKSLVRHLHLHTKEDPYQCLKCKSAFNRLDKLQHHIHVVHKKQHLSCQICSNNFTTLHTFRNHLAAHQTKCPHCPKMYFTKRGARNHIKFKHPETFQKCHVCQRSFQTEVLKAHVERVHNKIPFSCTFCPKVFHSESYFTKHTSTVHLREKDLTKCRQPGCPLIFNTSSAAEQHRLRYHPRPNEMDKLKCKICAKIFSSLSNLGVHLKTIHSHRKPSFKCTLCPKKYTAKSSCKIHITTAHTAEKAFQCDRVGCFANFAGSAQLWAHKLRHLDTELGRSYDCNKCRRVFKHKVLLESHKSKIHFGRGKQNCYFCTRVVGHYDMISHIRAHTREKPFKCLDCNNEFSLRTNLLRHGKVAHH